MNEYDEVLREMYEQNLPAHVRRQQWQARMGRVMTPYEACIELGMKPDDGKAAVRAGTLRTTPIRWFGRKGWGIYQGEVRRFLSEQTHG